MAFYQTTIAVSQKVQFKPLLDSSALEDADEDLFLQDLAICENHIAIDYGDCKCEISEILKIV